MSKSPKPDDIDDSSAPLIEHLAELRSRLIKAALAFILAMVACFSFATPIFNFLTEPLCAALAERGQNCDLIFISPQEGFFVAVVAPGLYRSEKGAFLPFLIASPFMFVLGAAFAFYAVTPLAYSFFLGFQQFGTSGEALEGVQGAAPVSVVFQGSAQEYLNLTIKFIVAFGVCFQLPVLLTLMGKAGLVSAAGLIAGRKWAVVGILTVAALVTPPDVVTQLMLFSVVYGLYEISILLVARSERKRNAQLRRDGLLDDEDEDEADLAEADSKK